MQTPEFTESSRLPSSVVPATYMHYAALILLSKRGGSLANSVLLWLRHLGGPGLVLLGVVDNSVVPIPGSLDALTVILAASQHDLWPYYAAMATIGAVIGGYLTYRIAQRESNEELEKRVPADKFKKVERVFDRWGFIAIVIIAILPPPAPMVPFLLAAGAAQYPRKKFLGALTVGRLARYGALAYLASIYGNAIRRIISNHINVLVILGVVCVGGGIAGALYLRHRAKSRDKKRQAHRAA
ncbi:MAG: YqaA family protein [Candidatus Acidiferrales bacterium]